MGGAPDSEDLGVEVKAVAEREAADSVAVDSVEVKEVVDSEAEET